MGRLTVNTRDIREAGAKQDNTRNHAKNSKPEHPYKRDRN